MLTIENPIEFIESKIGEDILIVWAELLDRRGNFLVRGRLDETVDVTFRGSVFRIMVDERHKVRGVAVSMRLI